MSISQITHADISAGKYKVLIDRSMRPVDGAYDFALYIEFNGYKHIIAEVFGRTGIETTQEAEQIANYIASLINNNGACKTPDYEVNSNANG